VKESARRRPEVARVLVVGLAVGSADATPYEVLAGWVVGSGFSVCEPDERVGAFVRGLEDAPSDPGLVDETEAAPASVEKLVAMLPGWNAALARPRSA
jgi:hypothetical protein